MAHLVELHDEDGPILRGPITMPSPAGAIVEALTGVVREEVWRQYGLSEVPGEVEIEPIRSYGGGVQIQPYHASLTIKRVG